MTAAPVSSKPQATGDQAQRERRCYRVVVEHRGRLRTPVVVASSASEAEDRATHIYGGNGDLGFVWARSIHPESIHGREVQRRA